MMNRYNIPITNIEEFTCVEYTGYAVIKSRTNEEALFRIGGDTRHYRLDGTAVEGIKIIWEGNPFNFENPIEYYRITK